MEWMEVFSTGRHVSAGGAERVWSQADLEHMAESYDPAQHEAPVVIGHPKTNAPAWGWIKALKVDGDKLLALPGQLAPEFAEWLKAGRWKKRSISVYPDGSLRHVGFLGAQPPAVKGLKDIEFAEEADIYEYTDQEDVMNEVEQLKQQLAEEKRLRVEEAGKRQQAEQSFAELAAQGKKKEIEDFVDQGIQAGKILPAWKKQGLAEFMATLDATVETYEFSEGTKQRPVEWFKGFLASFAEHPLFKAMTAPNEENAEDYAEEKKIGQDIASRAPNAKA